MKDKNSFKNAQKIYFRACTLLLLSYVLVYLFGYSGVIFSIPYVAFFLGLFNLWIALYFKKAIIYLRVDSKNPIASGFTNFFIFFAIGVLTWMKLHDIWNTPVAVTVFLLIPLPFIIKHIRSMFE